MSTQSRGTGAAFSVQIKKADAPAIVAVTGELDLLTAPQLKQVLGQVIDSAKTVILDLSGVTYMDSTGLGALIGGLKRARELGGDLKLAGLVPRVRKVFSITKIENVFEIYASVEQAILGDQTQGGIAS